MMGASSNPSRASDNRARYWREIAAALGLKALGLGLIYLLFFGPRNGLEPNAAAMFHHLMSVEDPSPTTHD